MTDQRSSSGTAEAPLDPTKEMAIAGRKALALVADRMEEAKLLATSSIDFWQRVGHEPANEIYKAMIEARPASPTPQIAEMETDQEFEDRSMKMDAADNLRLLDYIAGKIGLPHNEELSRENFCAWFNSTPQIALTDAQLQATALEAIQAAAKVQADAYVDPASKKIPVRAPATPQIAGGVREALERFSKSPWLPPYERKIAIEALAALSPQAQAGERPKCSLCGLEDGACICAHIPSHIEKSKWDVIDWKMEVERLNRLLGIAQAASEPAFDVMGTIDPNYAASFDRPTQGGDKGEAVAWQWVDPGNGTLGIITKNPVQRDRWIKEGYPPRNLYAAPQPTTAAEPFRTTAEFIVKAEQAKCHGAMHGCIRNVREDDCGQAGGSLIDAIAHALEDAAGA